MTLRLEATRPSSNGLEQDDVHARLTSSGLAGPSRNRGKLRLSGLSGLDVHFSGLHQHQMARFRSIALLILILAIMPWGAYTSALAAHAQKVTGSTFGLSDAAHDGASIHERTMSVVAAPKGKRCHGPAVLGSPCGPQAVVPAETTLVTPAEAIAAIRPGAGKLPLGMKPPGTLEPPRSS
jgi:hypothetical protein